MDVLTRRAPWSTAPPAPRTRLQDNPTLLFSWWCTGFSLVIIITRVCGRKVRSNVLFREDWIMLLAIIPLLIRMACIHVVLIWGTNNVQTVGYDFTSQEILHRSIGSRLVLATRIFYAAYIWMSKWTVSEFLKRITTRTWRRSYEITLRFIRAFLCVTFIGVCIATIGECTPINHYWQVVPDPGHQCRQGYAQLLTMGICDIITDILLVVFPIPIILTSGANWKRKLQLASLFSLSLIMIALTAMRMPEVIMHHGLQQYRTVWASGEIVAATAVANAVSLGSFLRDKGSKRNRYRATSQDESTERASVRRPTVTAYNRNCSDEDLFHSLGCRIPDHLQEKRSPILRPAPVAIFSDASPFGTSPRTKVPREAVEGRESSEDEGGRDHSSVSPLQAYSPPPSPGHNIHFFDMGGLLDDDRRLNTIREDTPAASPSGLSIVTAQRLTASGPPDYINHHQVSSHSMSNHHASSWSQLGVIPSPSVSISSQGSVVPTPPTRRSLSHANSHTNGIPSIDEYHLTNLLPAAAAAAPRGRRFRDWADHGRPPIGILGPMLERRETAQSLQDAGGLLSPTMVDRPASRPQRVEERAPDTQTTVQHGRPVVSDTGEFHRDDEILGKPSV